jgi:hypothetical protein
VLHGLAIWPIVLGCIATRRDPRGAQPAEPPGEKKAEPIENAAQPDFLSPSDAWVRHFPGI